MSIGGFPIEIETKISNLSYFHNTKIAKLYVISLRICVSISIGNPPYETNNLLLLKSDKFWIHNLSEICHCSGYIISKLFDLLIQIKKFI